MPWCPRTLHAPPTWSYALPPAAMLSWTGVARAGGAAVEICFGRAPGNPGTDSSRRREAGSRGQFDQRSVARPVGPEHPDDGTVDLPGGERGEQRETAGGLVRRRQAGHGTLDPGRAQAAPLAAPVFQLRRDPVTDRCWHGPGAGRVDGGTAAGEGILRHRIAARPGQV